MDELNVKFTVSPPSQKVNSHGLTLFFYTWSQQGKIKGGRGGDVKGEGEKHNGKKGELVS